MKDCKAHLSYETADRGTTLGKLDGPDPRVAPANIDIQHTDSQNCNQDNDVNQSIKFVNKQSHDFRQKNSKKQPTAAIVSADSLKLTTSNIFSRTMFYTQQKTLLHDILNQYGNQ